MDNIEKTLNQILTILKNTTEKLNRIDITLSKLEKKMDGINYNTTSVKNDLKSDIKDIKSDIRSLNNALDKF